MRVGGKLTPCRLHTKRHRMAEEDPVAANNNRCLFIRCLQEIFIYRQRFANVAVSSSASANGVSQWSCARDCLKAQTSNCPLKFEKCPVIVFSALA
ncbi:hypothetical protein AVEN_145306-1 [Araneus ventricosus]|uniref:Uncharacterized protein n=1 Tax=Araneus ventricosus TaxID=182803 RepID=A0A4Y2LIR9_ARAVE|nr:hypothetical protein AVEN_145306-1 [Araneus ventricosus]